MTRQWLSPPELMCLQHKLGEHAETHMFLRKMELGYSLKGFTTGSMFFGAEFVQQRHDMIAETLGGHKTPLFLSQEVVRNYPLLLPDNDDYTKSMTDLLTRCSECRKKHKRFLNMLS